MLSVNTIGKVGVGRIRQASDEPIDEMFLLGSQTAEPVLGPLPHIFETFGGARLRRHPHLRLPASVVSLSLLLEVPYLRLIHRSKEYRAFCGHALCQFRAKNLETVKGLVNFLGRQAILPAGLNLNEKVHITRQLRLAVPCVEVCKPATDASFLLSRKIKVMIDPGHQQPVHKIIADGERRAAGEKQWHQQHEPSALKISHRS